MKSFLDRRRSWEVEFLCDFVLIVMIVILVVMVTLGLLRSDD